MLCSVLFHVSPLQTVVEFVHCLLCVVLPFCHSCVSRSGRYEFSWQFATLVCRALFCIFLLAPCDVSAMCSVLYLYCLIVSYISALGTVLNVFLKIFTFVSTLHILLNVFCMIVGYGSASDTVLNVFCSIFCYVSVLHYFECVLYDCLSR